MKRENKVRWEFFGLFLWALLILGVGGFWLAIKIRASDGEVVPKGDGVAQIRISLNGVSLSEVKAGNKETEYFGNELAVTSNQKLVKYEDVKIEGRGNTTWTLLKKPWQIKLNKRAALTEGVEAKKWVLLANYLDASFMRNDVALKLAEMAGVSFSQRGDFAEVYFDNKNEGLYYLVPKIEIEKGGVELNDKLGVLVELDDLHGFAGDDGGCYFSYRGDCLSIEDAVSKKDEEVRAEAMKDFLKNYIGLEIAVENKNFEQVQNLVDVESLAKYFLVNEFTVNPDAYATSFYFYKDGVNDKIHAGPVWDFDFALANRKWNSSNNPNFYSPTETMALRSDSFSETGEKIKGGITYLMYDLMEFPEFQEEVRRVFRENLSGRGDELLAHYDLTVDKIRLVAEKDIALWREEEPSDKDFKMEVAWLRDWIAARYDYFEQIYGEEE